MKKLIFSLTLLLVSIAAQAYDVKVDGIYYKLDSSTKNAEVTYRSEAYNSYSGAVTIPSAITHEGNTYNVTSIGEFAFNLCSKMTSVSIPGSVVIIGNSAFHCCSGLTTIDIPNSVERLGEFAFSDCKGLTSVSISDNLRSIGNSAFNYCDGLTSITIPNSVLEIGNYVFYNCKNLNSVIIGDGVTSIGKAVFHNCTSLSSVKFGNSVRSIDERAFHGCTGLTTIDLPNSLTNIGWSVFEKSGLVSITIPNSVVEIGGYVCAYCEDLKTVSLGNNVSKIGEYAFKGCKNLNSLDVPNSVENIGEKIVEGCKSLTSIKIGSGLGDINYYSFSGCPELAAISVDANNPYYDSRNNSNAIIETESNTIIFGCKNSIFPNDVECVGDHAFYKCTGLTSIIIPSSVTVIGNNAFSGCGSLQSVIMGNGLKKIEESAFSGCNKITSINIPDKVETIGSNAFSGCSNLTSVNLPNNLKSIGEFAFYYCSNLTSVNLPNNLKSIGEYAFDGCSGLTSIDIPKCLTNVGANAFNNCDHIDAVNISDIIAWCNITFDFDPYNYEHYYPEFSNPLSNCGKLYLNGQLVENLVIPEGVTSINALCFYNCTCLKSVKIPESTTSIGSAAFYNCTNLTSINMHQNVTNIGSYAFYNCSSLKSITIPDNMTVIEKSTFDRCSSLTFFKIPNSVTRIEESAISRCTGLTSIDIPNSVESIGTGTFAWCSGLTSVSIGNGVKFIGEYTFKECSNLTKVYITDIEKWCNILFDDYNDNDYSYLFTSNPLTVAGNLYLNGVLVTDLVIPDGVKRINQAAFSNCTCLKSVTIPSSVKEFGWAAFRGVGKAYEPCILYAPSDYDFNVDTDVPSFKWNNGIFCLPGHQGEAGFVKDGLAFTVMENNSESKTGTMTVQAADKTISGDIDIPASLQYNNITYTIIGIEKKGFADCPNITSINIPIYCDQIGEKAFEGCTSLAKVTIDNDTLLNRKFTTYSSIKNIFGEQVKEYIIGENVKSIGNYAFYGCYNMTSITIHNNLAAFGWGSFQKCTHLTSVNIPQNIKTLPDCLFAYCYALKSVDLPSNLTSIKSSAFSECTGLSSITIPSRVTNIGSGAFSGCTGLTKVTIDNDSLVSKKFTSSSSLKNIFGAQVKDYVIGETVRSIGDYAFYGCTEMTTVVISGSVTEIGNYAFAKCSQIEDVFSYILDPPTIAKNTFTNETYSNATLHVIKQAIPYYESTEFWNKFTNIINFEDADIGSVTIKVIGKNDTDLTKQVSILWFDDKGSQIGTGSYIGGIQKDCMLYYSVILDESLGSIYRDVKKEPLVVEEGHQDVECRLSPIPQLTIRGNVWFNARPLPKAEVMVTQWLNGRYERTSSTKTDADGSFSIEACNDSTMITVTAEDCLDKRICFPNMDEGGDIGDVFMNPVEGKILMVDISYQSTVRDGTVADTKHWMDDLNSLKFSIYNVTQQKHEEVIHYNNGNIILPKDVNAKDVLEVTATSRTGQFAMASSRTTMNENDSAQVSLLLKELGALEVLYQAKNDDMLMAILFDAEGNMYASSYFSTQWVSFDKLEAGDYTLVTMGYYNNVGVVAGINDLDALCLTANEDYDIQKVCIQDGVISELTVSEVPELDLSKFEFTTDNTSYLPNKTSMSINQFFTMTARVDFQPQYMDGVSDAEIIVQLPKDSYLIDNSVLIDNSSSQYSIDGNKLHIPISREQFDKRVRFCIQPMNAGVLNTMANVRFNYKGERTSSVGYASVTCTSDQIHVPTKTNQKEILVSGMAPAKAAVDVYDNDMLVGSVTAKGDGTWKVMVPLFEPYNLTSHYIYANITKDNNTVKSITRKCKFDENAVYAKSVEMSFYNDWLQDVVRVIFDYENGTTSNNSYSFYKDTDFTFVADLSINDTIRVRDVEFLIKMTKGYWTALNGLFDENLQKWVAVGHFRSDDLPVNVVLDIDYDDIIEGDRQYLDDALDNLTLAINEQKKLVNMIDSVYEDNSDETEEILQKIKNLLANDNDDVKQIENLINQLDLGDLPDVSSVDIDSLVNEIEQSTAGYDRIIYALSKDSLYSLLHIDPLVKNIEIPQPPYNYAINHDDKSYNYTMEHVEEIDEQQLLNMGYTRLTMDDKTYLYTLFSDNLNIYIDTKNNIKYTLSIDNSDIVNNEPDKPSLIKDFYIPFDEINEIEQMIEQIINSFNFDVSPQIDIAMKSAEEDLKSLFAYPINDQADLERMIEGLDIILANYDVCYKQLYNDALSKLGKLLDVPNNIKIVLEHGDRLEEVMWALMRQLTRIRLHNKSLRLLDLQRKLSDLTGQVHLYNKQWKKLVKPITEYTQKCNNIFKKYIPVTANTKLSKHVMWVGKVGGSFASYFSVLIKVIGLCNDLSDARDDFQNWKELLDKIDDKIPCPRQPQTAINLRDKIRVDARKLVNNYIRVCLADVVSIGIDYAAATIKKPNPWLYITSGVFSVYAELSKTYSIKTKFMNLQGNYWTDVQLLRCKKDDPKPDPKEKDKDKKDNDNPPPTPPVTPIHDPSGYVYEAVPSNRVENVTATIYHDEDNPTLWDAEDFSQVNPIITDKTGVYAWDVPQGMWKVTFEKSGYEPKQTEWLPVPPPQLEVNIPMEHAVNPHVIKAYGAESGISLTFDKYMKPDILSQNGMVTVTRNGKDARGEVRMLNLEEDPLTQKEYASYVRFVPDHAFETTDDVVITVRKEVESYANMPMTENFVQRVVIHPDMKIVNDSLIVVDYKTSGSVTLAVQPAAASKGKYLVVESVSPMIASTDKEVVTLDGNGEAVVSVSGNLPGTTALRISMPNTELTSTALVNVVIHESVVRTPKASKRSGSVVEEGYMLTLSSATKGATIYYTTDGSCPCDEASRVRYERPIAITSDMTIKAIAVREGMEDSDIATFSYTVAGTGMDDVTLPNDIDVTYLNGMVVVTGAEGATCRIYDTMGRLLAARRVSGDKDSFTVPYDNTYIVAVEVMGKRTFVRKITKSNNIN